MHHRNLIFCLVGFVFSGNALRLFAGADSDSSSPLTGSRQVLSLDDDDDKPKSGGTSASNPSAERYFFGLLDDRSRYGKDFFHDPLLGPEFDAEKQLELDYTHGERRGFQDDEIDAGFQWNLVGKLTVSGEFGWESQHQDGSSAGGDGDDAGRASARGFDNVDLAIYHPLLQFVSVDGIIDYTAVGRLDVSLPTHTAVSGTDVQLAPYLGHLLRIGQHLSIEAWTGVLFPITPHPTDELIYGASFGYMLSHDQFPGVESITPIIELDGQAPFSGRSQDVLFGVAGFQMEFESVRGLSPVIEIGYQFPIDQGARDQLRWGVTTQLFFQF